MALLHMDSFSFYTDIFKNNWQELVGSNRYEIESGAGRFGNDAFHVKGDQSYGVIFRSLAGSFGPTFIMGVAFKTNYAPSYAAGEDSLRIFSLFDAAPTWNIRSEEQVYLRLNPSLQLEVMRGGYTTPLGSTARQLRLNAYQFIEFKTLIHGSAGTAEVRVNGEVWLSLSSLNTQRTGNATAGFFAMGRWAGYGDSRQERFSDLYICDSTGSRNNDFKGDRRVVRRMAAGAGSSTQFTPSAGANYACVNQNPDDGDSTYVQDGTVGHKDFYTIVALPSGATDVDAVAVTHRARKTDASARSFAAAIKSSSSEVFGADQALSLDYLNYTTIFEADPNGPADWTPAAVNSAEFGQKLTV